MRARYCIFHNSYGMFQGESRGLSFWYPNNGMPGPGVMLMFESDAHQFLQNLENKTWRGDVSLLPWHGIVDQYGCGIVSWRLGSD